MDEAASIEAARLGRAAGAQVTCDLDAIGAGTAALLAELTIPILAQGLPEAITGEADPERALRKLPAPHARLRCVTLGAQGALLLDGDRVVRCAAAGGGRRRHDRRRRRVPRGVHRGAAARRHRRSACCASPPPPPR